MIKCDCDAKPVIDSKRRIGRYLKQRFIHLCTIPFLVFYYVLRLRLGSDVFRCDTFLSFQVKFVPCVVNIAQFHHTTHYIAYILHPILYTSSFRCTLINEKNKLHLYVIDLSACVPNDVLQIL